LAAQNTKDKEKKKDLMFYHKSFGLLAGFLLAPRLIARVMSKIPGAVPGASSLEHMAANITHYVLYGFIIVMPVSGVIMGLNSGFGLPFFFTTFPSPRKDPPVAKQAFEIHKTAGQIFEYVILLHLAGTAWHVVRGHPILRRMVPGMANPAMKK
jgi:cytochrome b561